MQGFNYMEKIKRLTILLFIITFFSSCIYKRIYLTEDDLVWMTPYEQGDSILFRSGNDLDTLIIQEKTVYNEFGIISKRFEEHEAHGTAHYKGIIIHNTEPLRFLYHIQRIKSSHLTTLFCFSERSCTIFVDDSTETHSMLVNNEVCRDIIKFDASDLEWAKYLISPYNCEYVLWSKTKGLVQYKYADNDSIKGKVYSLYKKL